MYDKKDEYGHDLVIWNLEPYTLEEDNDGCDLKEGDRVVNVTNLCHLDKRQIWFSSSSTKSTLKLLPVVVADIVMTTDSLPRGFTSKSIKGNYMVRIVLDEINRRDRLNYEEDCVNTLYDSDEEIL